MRYLALLLAALAGTLLLVPAAQAATGGTTTLPLPQPPPPPGKKVKPNLRAMTITIDTTWAECNGYRPVRFIIKPTPPLVADRTLTLKIEPRGWTGGQPRITMTQDVEVPAGATSVTAVMAVPQLEAWNSFSFDVLDDGVPAPELSVPMHRLTINTNNNLWGDGASPTMLLLGAPKLANNAFVPFSRTMESAVPIGLQPTTITSGAATLPVGGGKFAGITGIPSHADLPTRWIDYSGLDIVYVELPELEQFIQEFPEQWKAIREWLSTGGNLWVGGVGKRWQRVEQLEMLLELPVPIASEMDDPRGWTAPDEKRRYEALKGLGSSYAAQGVAVEAVSATASKELAQFRMRSLGRGQVLAFGHDDPLNEIQHNESWTWIFNSMGPERWSWYRRHGISLQRENRDFWDFLIPGVGLAPVTAFQVLITLFVLTIGPLNFYLLRRWRKLNLIMITVPISALAVTGALLFYALVADGLSVRARARSLTEIDQRRGETVCWARLSYYAGLRPSQGLAFPTDTAVYPIDHEAQGNHYNQNRQRRVIDWGTKQYLGGGWLNARTPTQLLTVAFRPATHTLQILETGASPPEVENLLGTRIQQLMLIDSKGQAFHAQDLAAGDKVPLSPATNQQNAAQLTQLMHLHRPKRPEGMNNDTYGLFGVRRRYSYNYYSTGQDMDAVTMHTSILERGLQELTNADKLWQPRSYAALVDRSPEMSFGLESVNEEAGFHVIVGKW